MHRGGERVRDSENTCEGGEGEIDREKREERERKMERGESER